MSDTVKAVATKPGFTPGPWRFDPLNTIIVSDAAKSESGSPMQVIDLMGVMGGDDSDADVRLIAAAPRMYAALEAVNLAAVSLDPETFEYGFCVQWNSIQKVMTALAEVRGEIARFDSIEALMADLNDDEGQAA